MPSRIEPVSQAISQPQNPCNRPTAAKASVAPAPIQTIGVRRSRKPSDQRASAGAATVRAKDGAARITPIWAPLRPCALNQSGMNGRLAPEPTNRAA